jgi:hypothetical protein
MVEKLRESRARIQDEMAQLSNEQMTLPVPGRQTPANVRFMYYRIIAHQVEHTVHLIQTLAGLGVHQTEAQLILNNLQVARGKLEGLLIGLTDEDLEREPADGEWSPKQVLEHIVETEETYASRIREAIQAAPST